MWTMSATYSDISRRQTKPGGLSGWGRDGNIKPGRERDTGAACEVKSEGAFNRSVKKSTNGSFHMWKMHSREHTDISTHPVINLFLPLLSLPPCISPHSASHHSFFAKSYEADFLSSASLCVIDKTGIMSLCFPLPHDLEEFLMFLFFLCISYFC